MVHTRYIFFFCLVLAALASEAQSPGSNLRRKKIAASGNVQLDSLSIVPSSLQIAGVDTSYYELNAVTALLKWKKPNGVDSVLVQYRVFPFQFDATAYRYHYDSLRKATVFTPYVVEPSRERTGSASVFDFGDIQYNGSFGRSLSFGNSQDAVLNSQLNLQMSGYIGDSIEIAAAITDNNLPIQPDGTTRQLNEFDRILLQFRKKGWELSLGDIDIRQGSSYFLNFYKRLQGVSYLQDNRIGTDGRNRTLVSGAIAKGKFTRNIFQGLEGNQGPYRLQGANHEFYFVVLAGTERVFLDGELLQRGEDQDYIINYNTAEITFMPKRMITKDRRIQVEFEYADRNFLNAMFYGTNEITVNKRLTAFISYYRNTDAKNSPINQELDAGQKLFLSNLGDSLQQAFYPLASVDSFSTARIMYKKVDTTYGGVTETIYVYSNHRDSARYTLNFVEVGQGRGNYVPFFNAANGKVYRWVEPVGGVKQGSFEPAQFLVTPKKHEVIAAGFSYQLNEKTKLTTEAALSNFDANAFSEKDKSDNKGVAAKFRLDRKDRFKSSKNRYDLSTSVGYEFVQSRFRPVERLRAVEFGRDWGLGLQYTAADEHLPAFSVELSDKNRNHIGYHLAAYLRSDRFSAWRHELRQQYSLQGWQLKSNINFTNHHSLQEQGFFFRPTVEVSKQLPRLKGYVIGAGYSREHNEQRNKLYDTLSPQSFYFDIVSAFIKSNPSLLNRWSFSYFTRADKLPSGYRLLPVDRSHNYSFGLELMQHRNHQLRSTITYRQLVQSGKTAPASNTGNSLLGRVEYLFQEWNGLVSGTVLYELGAGQEQKRDYAYIEVPAGRGEYAWNDYNADGIPQLNEFELAAFPDQAKYIRFFSPTNEYIKAGYTQLNYSLTVDPRAIAARIGAGGWRNFITRFYLHSALQTGSKIISNGEPVFNPFQSALDNESLISLNQVLSNSVSFNRSSSKWGLDLSNVSSFSKALLTYGLESRRLSDWIIKGRLNFGSGYGLELIRRSGRNLLSTPKFANRNFEIETSTIEPRLMFTELTKYRLLASYQYNRKKNAAAQGGELAISNVLSLEAKYNVLQHTSLLGRFSLNRISYQGPVNTTTSYIMLDGLVPGQNLLWLVDLTKRFANNLELNFQYEGRKPADHRTIHIGRASIRALL